MCMCWELCALSLYVSLGTRLWHAKVKGVGGVG